jgi:hypothetical protein
MDIEKANRLIDRASIIKEFVRHPGFKILETEINTKIQDGKNLWLSADTKDKAEEIRLQTKPWQDILNLLKKLILQGEASRQLLQSQENEVTN